MGRPAGHTAVMADRARGEVAADSATLALYRKLEFFPTPPWGGRAGGEVIAELDPHVPEDGQWTARDPACGQGHLRYALLPYFSRVEASDVHAYTPATTVADFLSPDADALEPVDWIVTNPPFIRSADFVTAGLRRARRGVAILARAALLESAGRYPLFFGPESRFVAYAPFVERVPMVLGGWDPKASTATAYAWFVFMHPAAMADVSRRTRRLVPDAPIVRPIPPGTRERLTRPDDARLFGRRTLGPTLFEEGAAP